MRKIVFALLFLAIITVESFLSLPCAAKNFSEKDSLNLGSEEKFPEASENYQGHYYEY